MARIKIADLATGTDSYLTELRSTQSEAIVGGGYAYIGGYRSYGHGGVVVAGYGNRSYGQGGYIAGDGNGNYKSGKYSYGYPSH